MNRYKSVLNFWYHELTPKDWFAKSDELDQKIKEDFRSLLEEGASGALSSWEQSPLSMLALIILLDQFSRNIYRDTNLAFSNDQQAIALAKKAVKFGFDKELKRDQAVFMYMPYMHSEDLKIHEEAIVLFEQEGFENYLKFEIKHKIIIERFGRYPHRNEILGRESTKEEKEFLTQEGSSF